MLLSINSGILLDLFMQSCMVYIKSYQALLWHLASWLVCVSTSHPCALFHNSFSCLPRTSAPFVLFPTIRQHLLWPRQTWLIWTMLQITTLHTFMSARKELKLFCGRSSLEIKMPKIVVPNNWRGELLTEIGLWQARNPAWEASGNSCSVVVALWCSGLSLHLRTGFNLLSLHSAWQDTGSTDIFYNFK